MATFQGLCPKCGKVGDWTFDPVSISLPPTGGDYEWTELHTPTSCPHCQASFQARVRADIDDRQVSMLIHSPWPKIEDWECFVVAEITNFARDMVSVRVRHFAATQAEAEAALEKVGGHYDGGYQQRLVLRMTKTGYHRLDGKTLHESASYDLEYY